MDTAKAIELIGKSSHISLIIPEDPDFDVLASAEVLARVLQNRGKTVGLFPEIKKEGILSAETFPSLSSSPKLLKEFVVSLDTSVSQVSQLRYEKEDNRIDVVFSPKGKVISKDAVSFREGKVISDAAFAIGVPDIEGAQSPSPEFFKETPIINLDITAENKQFGEVNLVDAEKSSLAEAVYELAGSFTQEPLGKDEANLLLGAIINKTENFNSSRTSAGTFLTVSELMRLGADLARAKQFTPEQNSHSLIQLAGRAAVRSRFDRAKRILWSFLTAEDFEKTGRTNEDVPRALERVNSQFPGHRAIALLWQNQEGGVVNAILSGEQPLLSALEARGAGKFQSQYLALGATFESFREAEEIINSLLEGVL